MNRRIQLFGLDFAAGRRVEIVEEAIGRLSSDECLFILTANVDSIIRLVHASPEDEFSRACRFADIVVADGMPIVWASRLLKQPLPERVTGVDLTLDLCAEAAKRGLSVFLFGAQEHVATRAARILQDAFPTLTIKGVYSPPLGFESKAADSAKALDLINQQSPDLLFVALGQPKAEKWIGRFKDLLNAKLVIGVGGTFDIISGRFSRAPEFFRRWGLEWFWRLVQDPVRLGKRYARNALIFPNIVLQEWRRMRRSDENTNK